MINRPMNRSAESKMADPVSGRLIKGPEEKIFRAFYIYI